MATNILRQSGHMVEPIIRPYNRDDAIYGFHCGPEPTEHRQKISRPWMADTLSCYTERIVRPKKLELHDFIFDNKGER
jgi:hypothetical protein